ncbi:MAG TPA: hypothetical protein ENN67_07365 [Firmicutes bacterium]|nr:hypothetical protein [Bacillota bacterium]
MVTNDGFNFDKPISNWLNVSGHAKPSFFIWMMLSGFFWSFIISFFSRGPAKTISSIVTAPVRYIGLFAKSGLSSMGALAVGVGIALLLSGIFAFNKQASMTTMISWAFLGMGYPGYLLSKGIHRAFGGVSKNGKITIHAVQVMVASIAVGFLMGLIVGNQTLGIILGMFFLVGGIIVWVVLSGEQRKVPIGMMIVLFGGIAALFYLILDTIIGRPAFADDGGWTEFKWNNPDGTVGDWFKDDASHQAIAHGHTPAFGAGIGALFPQLDGEIDPEFRAQLVTMLSNSIRDMQMIYSSGIRFPEGTVLTASAAPPTWFQITESLRQAMETIKPGQSGGSNWFDYRNITEKGRWTRALVVGLLAASIPFTAGLSAPWVLGIGAAAAAADKYGPDATQILEMFVGGPEKGK